MYDDTPESAPLDWSSPKRRPQDPRSSTAYRQLQAEFIRLHRLHRNPDGSVGSPCSLPGCGRPINYLLKYPHPQSPSLDHIIPVKDRPDLVLSEANMRISHLVCNQRRNGEVEDDDLDLGEPSEIW